MNNLSQKIWTYQLNGGSILIDASFDIVVLSITLNSGTGSFTGTATAGGVVSAPVDLVVGQAVTISSNGTIPLDGFTITTTGVIGIVGKQ